MQSTPPFPRLDVLPPAQQAVWAELCEIPDAFTLYGGTAIALYLGHRESVDFDFFCFEDFDPDEMFESIPLLRGGQITQRAANTLTCNVDKGGLVQISFFGIRGLCAVAPPTIASDNGLKIASLLDLAGMKVSVVQKRAQVKDYIDIDALISSGVDLPSALSAGAIIYGSQFNPLIALKALSWFGDGNLAKLPSATKSRLEAAVKAVDLDRLPDLSALLEGSGS
jgi:Nucleotidyl transferase AbiEii toxin, Type IV TA system